MHGNLNKPQAGWLTPVISVEPEDHEIEASLGYIVRPCLSKQTRNLIFQGYSRKKKCVVLPLIRTGIDSRITVRITELKLTLSVH